ncbi:SDR family oxidoreductase [Pengzhenrongella sp.]|uniref:SDR family oxidoreductase n=1 Tax=Pengzhenrongella sp. TaxID=2888820 RepID=UPI002F952B49
MILVAGGTGRLGAMVVRHLVDQGLAVRVLTRDPARAGRLFADRVDVCHGDVRDRSSLLPALRDVQVVLCAVHGFGGSQGQSPATVDRDGNANLVDVAKHAGADVVLMSVVGAAPDSPVELFRMKHAAEQHLLASGVSATIVRATAYLELWIEILTGTVDRSGRPLVFGRGENPINFVSVVDVAALVERAITDHALRGTALEIGGPKNLTFNQLASAVAAAAGSTRPPRHLPPPVLRVLAGTAGRVRPGLGAQLRAALDLDSADHTFDAAGHRQLYPDLPVTSLEAALATSPWGVATR